MSVKQEILFVCSELIRVSSHALICPLLCPKVSAKKIHYCGKKNLLCRLGPGRDWLPR